ncbi:sensor histidine kinase [Saccharothrix violaceirubra]|uniref:histidine kinase n=1 Tax=Saccharothrix violaceirubra TaxID=413306 RepID=A0A7W7WXE5_9PSEU|nr:histidine kinase [Saccharothrix violaceirubra]MBB4966528.1 signal transduction histidine kinase [Saccharothrix violaceirubra]
MVDVLRSLWREPRPGPGPGPVWWDWVLVAVLVPVALVEGLTRHGVWSAVVAAGLVFVLPWRRRAPFPVVVIAFGGCFVLSLVFRREFPDQGVLAYLLLLPFSLFRWGSGRDAVSGAVVMVGKVGLSASLGYLAWGDALAGVGILAAAMALGAAVRYRVRARARELDQAKSWERERLARDLHDTVAHHVSAMAVRAQAGIALAATDPGAAVDALRVIDVEAGKALDEMRGIVRILRAVDPVEGTPRFDDLGTLASRGTPVVDIEVVGDATGLPAPVGTAVFRLAQEAVTNARRHARDATRVHVRVDVDAAVVRLRVSDDGRASSSATPGYGLVGMVERATLLGGTCVAGPDDGRGWLVAAELPKVTP